MAGENGVKVRRTLPEPGGGVAARGAAGLLDVVRPPTAATAQSVRLGVPLTKRCRTLTL
jgi:hypothetical protein